MDPKSIAKVAAPPPEPEAEVEIWEPPFERWQRLTEALIAQTDRVCESVPPRRSPRR